MQSMRARREQALAISERPHPTESQSHMQGSASAVRDELDPRICGSSQVGPPVEMRRMSGFRKGANFFIWRVRDAGWFR